MYSKQVVISHCFCLYQAYITILFSNVYVI